MSTLLPIDCAVCKQAAVALSGVLLVEVPERGDTLCRLLARTAESCSTAGHNQLASVYLTARLVLPSGR
jgi:hypothetical protein